MSAKRLSAPATGSSIAIPDPSRQVRFYQLLLAARQTWLMDALSATLRTLDANVIKEELAALVPADVQASSPVQEFATSTSSRPLPS